MHALCTCHIQTVPVTIILVFECVLKKNNFFTADKWFLSTWCKVLTAAMLLIRLAFILPFVVPYFPHIYHRQVWSSYSPSLPDYIPHFLGHDKEIEDLVRLLDPENTDVRTVSIVGPPGFGKSSLALHVGHEQRSDRELCESR